MSAQVPDKPSMTEAEIALLDKYTPFGGKVLEFGCGGSTKHFFERGVEHLISIDSDPEWLRALMGDPRLQHFGSKKRWLAMHVDIGPTVEWGRPKNKKEPSCAWLSYHQFCWQGMPHTDFNMVLVDGRFRVACLLQSILRCPADIIYFVHDFVHRPYYAPMLEFTEQIDQADTAVVLRPKASIDWKELCLRLQEYQLNFS